MSKFNVTFVPSLNRKPEVIEAEDVFAVSDYTVQFLDNSGHAKLILGGVERVEVITAPENPTPVTTTPILTTIDTTGKPANVPRGAIPDDSPDTNPATLPSPS